MHQRKRLIATMLTALAAFLVVFIDPPFTSAQEAFEITSVKPFSPAAGRGARVGAAETASSACVARPQVSPGRLQFSGATVHGLIASAYGTSCLLVSGGPAWMKSERFEVQALFPVGAPNYTARQIQNGNAPRLKAMLQTLLTDRFKLALHRETKEMAVYNLVFVKEAKNLKLSADQNAPDNAPSPPLFDGMRGPALGAPAIAMSALAALLSVPLGRPVIDKTNLKGVFDVRVEYDGERIAIDPVGARITAIEEQLGLKLESSRALVEVIVIDRIERPSEN